MKKKTNKIVEIAAVGAGIAATSAAAYILFGPEGKKNRKAIKGWAVKMKGEIIEKLEEAKELTEPVYNKVVDEVSKKYAKSKNVDKKEVEAIIKDIKKHWTIISKTGKKPAKKGKGK